jgi:hypothetical protein
MINHTQRAFHPTECKQDKRLFFVDFVGKQEFALSMAQFTPGLAE